MDYGFIKTAAAIPALKVGDTAFNAAEIEKLIAQSAKQKVSVIVFPELCITGYTCGDLFLQSPLLNAAEESLLTLIKNTAKTDIIAIVGLPVVSGANLLNAAVVFYKGKILGIVPKSYLPNYKEFYEKRWFTPALEWKGQEISLCGQKVPAGTDLIFKAGHASFGIEICEDLWAVNPPSGTMALSGAEIIFNLSASNELAGKNAYLRSLIAQQSARCIGGYIYAGCGFGESTTDVVFGGNALIYENGHLLAQAERFCFNPQLVVSEIDTQRLQNERRANTSFAQSAALLTQKARIIESGLKAPAIKLTRQVEPLPFIPKGGKLTENCSEIFNIQTAALAKRFTHTKAKTAVIGISGGLDSTLALLVCVKTFDKLGLNRKDILGITMPGFGTTKRTYNNALALMAALGITSREVDIKPACLQHFKDIGHNKDSHDITYENTQARERTQILMDSANKTNGLVIGTGDLSELSLGWATYNGDHMSMYGVNCGVPKTLVKHLTGWAAQNEFEPKTRDILLDIIATPISPELLPAAKNGKIAQKTEDIVGPYELHDFFLYYFLRFGFGPAKIYFLACNAFAAAYKPAVIKKWLEVFFRRFFAQQFKRSAMPDGPKVGSAALSPRGDWRMPSDASAAAYLKELDKIK